MCPSCFSSFFAVCVPRLPLRCIYLLLCRIIFMSTLMSHLSSCGFPTIFSINYCQLQPCFARSTTAISYPVSLDHHYLHSINNRQLLLRFPRSPTLRSIKHHNLLPSFARSSLSLFDQQPQSALYHHHNLSINNRQLLRNFARSPPASFDQSTATLSYPASINHRQPNIFAQSPSASHLRSITTSQL